MAFPVTNPRKNPNLDDFFERLKQQPRDFNGAQSLDSVANPKANPGVIEITEPITSNLDPNTPTIIAITTDGRIVFNIASAGSLAKYEVPGQDPIPTLRQLMIDRYGPRLLP